MITNEFLKEYELDTIEEYYEYIINSKALGLSVLAREMFNKLSEEQKLKFFGWAEAAYYYDAHDCDEMSELQNLINYFKN
jgi:hypothetical protein